MDWISFVTMLGLLLVVLGVLILVKEVRTRGICPRCNIPLTYSGLDMRIGIKYNCDKCGYFTWDSWPMARRTT